MESKFCCPNCGQEIAPYNVAWIHFLHRLDLPHFMCGKCRLVYYDKPMIRGCVTWLRKQDGGARRVPFKVLYARVIKYMDEIMKYNVEKLGYKIVRFKKK